MDAKNAPIARLTPFEERLRLDHLLFFFPQNPLSDYFAEEDAHSN